MSWFDYHATHMLWGEPMVALRELVPPEAATVLLTEDDPDIRELVAAFLDDLGYLVLAAADAQEALRLFDAHEEIALLLTDVTLPGGTTGFTLARQAQRRRPGLKVIYASGHMRAGDWPDPDEMLGPLLTKPFRLGDLQRQIESALHH
jgi:CheY-like chemotaxis protein